MTPRLGVWLAGALAVWSWGCLAQGVPSGDKAADAELKYWHDRQPDVPWSIHVTRIPRRSGHFELHSVHATGHALGLATVSEQTSILNSELGNPVSAINGDFYERSGNYLGDPRGLQITEGELVSAPVGTASFWIDAAGEPHAGNTTSQLQVIWPNGTTAEIGLNESRDPNAIVLFTPAAGTSTRSRGGREMILEQCENMPWLPLRAGKMYRARVVEVRNTGNTALTDKTMVLSIGQAAVRSCPAIATGAEIQLSTGMQPDLRGVKTAISGGPVLVRDGKAVRLRGAGGDTYQTGSAFERHPRSAVGWNDDFFFFVEVDGRNDRVSIGMTLQELGAYLAKLGCRFGMNLDGGGSSTLWYAGRVRNRPCDGRERPVANALVALEHEGKTKAAAPALSPRAPASP